MLYEVPYPSRAARCSALMQCCSGSTRYASAFVSYRTVPRTSPIPQPSASLHNPNLSIELTGQATRSRSARPAVSLSLFWCCSTSPRLPGIPYPDRLRVYCTVCVHTLLIGACRAGCLFSRCQSSSVQPLHRAQGDVIQLHHQTPSPRILRGEGRATFSMQHYFPIPSTTRTISIALPERYFPTSTTAAPTAPAAPDAYLRITPAPDASGSPP
jgi:hypothetical protein